jgi:hypothetical protein
LQNIILQLIAEQPSYIYLLMKLVIGEVPTKVGQYADYKLIVLFKTTVAYLEGGSQE